jgi:transcriptional repressor NrdR
LREIGSDKIGELVMRELRKIDKVAYVRFASVYKNFEDVDEFADAVREVQPAAKRAAVQPAAKGSAIQVLGRQTRRTVK